MREELYLLGVSPAFMRKLTKNNVHSLSDLVAMPVSTLAQALRTPEEALVPLVSKARSILSTPLVPASYRDDRVLTGVRELDAVLDGGLIPGGMYEVIGHPGVDATKFCLRVAVSLILTSEKRVLFCDSEGNFSLAMVEQLVTGKKRVEELFGYVRVGTHGQVQQVVGEMESLGPVPFLVVMDGLPALLRCPPFTEHSFDRTQKAIETALSLQSLCNRHSLVLLVTNKYTSVSQDFTPVLGESWGQAFIARVFLEKTSEGVAIRAQKSVGVDVSSELVSFSL